MKYMKKANIPVLYVYRTYMSRYIGYIASVYQSGREAMLPILYRFYLLSLRVK